MKIDELVTYDPEDAEHCATDKCEEDGNAVRMCRQPYDKAGQATEQSHIRSNRNSTKFVTETSDERTTNGTRNVEECYNISRLSL